MARAHRPDVAVLNLQMPDRDGISVAAELAATAPDCAVVIVTGHGWAGHLKQPPFAGVRGLLPKTVNAGVLTEASVPCMAAVGTSILSWPQRRSARAHDLLPARHEVGLY